MHILDVVYHIYVVSNQPRIRLPLKMAECLQTELTRLSQSQ